MDPATEVGAAAPSFSLQQWEGLDSMDHAKLDK